MEGDNVLSEILLQLPPPSLILFTDASQSGWGAHMAKLTAAGEWLTEEEFTHINSLKMRQSFQHS